MQNQVLNCLNSFFNNINYDLSSYNNVITEVRLENLFYKVVFSLVALSIIKVFIFYALLSFKTKSSKKKNTLILCKGKKIIKGAINYSKGERITQAIYLSTYVLIYVVAGYIIVGGVF